MIKNVENFVKWVDKESKTDALKMVFSWNNKTNRGTVRSYICGMFDITLQNTIPCTRQEFELAKKLPPEKLAMVILGA